MIAHGTLMRCVCAARRRSQAIGRCLWIEERNDHLAVHLACRDGWHLRAIVIGDDVWVIIIEDEEM